MTLFKVTHIGMHEQKGNWMLAVEYKDKEVERFVLKFRNEEQLRLWESTLGKVKEAHKTHVPNTHLLSMGAAPMTPVPSGDGGLYLLDDDDDTDDDDDDADEEPDFYAARSRSNSVSANQVLRPKMMRNNSQDAAMFMATRHQQQQQQQPPMPGMNLSPLPRAHHHHPPTTPPLEYNGYPVSPPPSSPSSPGTSSRTSTSTSSWHHRRNEDGSSPLTDIASKFMSATDAIAPSSEDPPMRMNGASPARSQSHTTMPAHAMYQQQQPPIPSPSYSTTRSHPHHQRVRSQSSPNIHKQYPPQQQQWEDLPQMPSINSRTLYSNSSTSSGRTFATAPAGTTMAAPRLSETASSLQSQIDRVVSAVPNSPGTVKIKLSYNDGIYVIVVSESISFAELMEKVEKKIRLVANIRPTDILRLKYQDEDGDLITINSDDDVQMAFENRNTALNLFVSI